MTRAVLAALAGALIYAAPMRADDKPAEKPKDRNAQLNDLRQEIQKQMPEVRQAFMTAKSNEDREKALAKFDPIREKGYKLVEENPKDDVSYMTLMMVMGTAPQPPEKALDLLAKNFADDPRIAMFVMQMADNPSAAKLVVAAEKSKNKSVAGAVALGRAKKKVDAIEEAKDGHSDKLAAEAEQMLTKVAKDFGNAPLMGSTVEEMANKSLFYLRNLLVGKTAPEAVGHNLEGKEDKLSNYRGKVVVLDFWATWCGWCVKMLPHEREMVEKLKDKPFALISISADSTKKEVESFLEKEKMPWTHWWEGMGGNGIPNKWNVNSYPTIYVLDAKGVIRYKNVRDKELEEAVTKLLEEMEKK